MKLYSGIIELKTGWFVRLPCPMTMMEMARYRFDPITIAAGAAVVGMGMSAYATLEEGKQTDELSKISQRQYEAEAKAAEQAGQYESREKRKEAQRAKATQIAQMSANGGLLTGSNLLILAETAKNYEDDALVIARNYKVEATRLRNRGAIIRYQGQVAKRNSRIRAFTGVMTGIGSMGLKGS